MASPKNEVFAGGQFSSARVELSARAFLLLHFSMFPAGHQLPSGQCVLQGFFISKERIKNAEL